VRFAIICRTKEETFNSEVVLLSPGSFEVLSFQSCDQLKKSDLFALNYSRLILLKEFSQ
jgi:hypothetical protein